MKAPIPAAEGRVVGRVGHRLDERLDTPLGLIDGASWSGLQAPYADSSPLPAAGGATGERSASVGCRIASLVRSTSAAC